MTAEFTIGMVGPVTPSYLRDFLDMRGMPSDLPAGMGGTPVTLLSRALLEAGYVLKIFTLDPRLTDEVILNGEQLQIYIGPNRPRPRTRALDFFAKEQDYLSKAIRRENPNVLHAHWTYEFALGALKTGIPTVVTAHDAPVNVLKHMFNAYRAIRLIMAYDALYRTHHCVAVSPYIAQHLRRFRLYKGPISIIPNGLESRMFLNRHWSSWRDRQPVFATVLNGWADMKNGKVALQAFCIVQREIRNARLLMFGAGHGWGQAGHEWAVANKLDRGVEFVGEVAYESLLKRLSTEVGILVHPSLEEACSMALMEAMAMGIAVIGGASSGGVPWSLDEGRAGILVDVESPISVAKAMLRLARDVDEQAAWGQRGYEYASRRFRLETVTASYIEEYINAMKGKDARLACS